MNLNDTLEALLKREGRYSNNPSDRGGETMWGVTAAVARAFGYLGPMASMSRDTAKQIYIERYWLQPQLDKVNGLNPSIAEEMLDTGVNMGSAIACRFLQRALNVLNNGHTSWPDIAVDGVLGKMTLYCLGQFLANRGEEGRATLLRMLNAQQSVRYIAIAEEDPSQEANEFGWQSKRVT